MRRVVIFGLQWGDEGKGKVVTYFSREFDWVVRYSGGSNAGHTVVYSDDTKVINHLVPSFDIRSRACGYIGPGVVLDPLELVKELGELERIFGGIGERLKISNLCHVVLPPHKEIDASIDVKRSCSLSTTRRGIGPALADRAYRIGLRLVELLESGSQRKMEEYSKDLKVLYGVEWRDYTTVLEAVERLKPHVIDLMTSKRLLEESSILFEGTQGVLLDVDIGTYPYVTSSNCGVTGIEPGLGFPVSLDERLGVFKAYTTRVGAGPFPTELPGFEGDELRERGHEFGATTGRKRRCGWLDLPLVRFANEVSKTTGMILTKADVLNGIDQLRVCVAYKIGGRLVEVPSDLSVLERVTPMYADVKPWQDLRDPAFEKFVKFVEEETGVPVRYVSTGPGVDEMVAR
ncbi:MAG: adenylosuccinate synthase [Thermotogae bacterium]|nr:MAG: adenylosuccinate synthase [Thermotogota bacterium]